MAGRGEMMGCVCVDNNMVEEEDSGLWTLDTLIRPVQIFVFRAAAVGLGRINVIVARAVLTEAGCRGCYPRLIVRSLLWVLAR